LGGGTIGATYGINGQILLFTPGIATRKMIDARLNYRKTTGNFGAQVYGYGQWSGSANAVDRVRFYLATGTFASGTITMYGKTET
jgi:hypothetical protein